MTRDARTPEMADAYDKYRKSLNGRCPFCDMDNEINDILEENEYWIFFKNAFQYKDTVHHYLLIPRTHVLDVMDLPEEERLAFDLKHNQLMKELSRDLTFARGRNEQGRSVEHFHYHFKEEKNED